MADPTLHAAPATQRVAATGGAIHLLGLHKQFDDVPAVRGIDLEIAPGEFFSLLGPSGCGKTTTLRMIAGFEQPSSGQILLDGVDVAPVPPNRRPVNTVFQNYALFPFMSVRDNVAFGLKYASADKNEIRRRADEALALVRMEPYARRRPGQLSGGQQQRVALARALVLNPRVLLLDEPLGALDAKLRKTLQIELKALQETIGITFVYVTHDQDEALTMSDRLAVMAGGRIEQVGTPSEVYERPVSAYVADFLGAANVVDVEVLGPAGDELTAFRWHGTVLHAAGPAHAPGPAKLVVRPERLGLNSAIVSETSPLGRADSRPAADEVDAVVERIIYRGPTAEAVVRVGGISPIVVVMSADQGPRHHSGQDVRLHLPVEALRLLPQGGPPA